MLLSQEEIELVQEAIWLAKRARASNPPKYGEIDLRDPSVFQSAFAEETVQQRALYRFIDNLPRADRGMLQAVMYLGRTGSSHTRKTFRALRERMRRDSDDAARQMTEKASLPEYLRNGLKKLGLRSKKLRQR